VVNVHCLVVVVVAAVAVVVVCQCGVIRNALSPPSPSSSTVSSQCVFVCACVRAYMCWPCCTLVRMFVCSRLA
jgi:hypothetical protein